MKKQCCILGLKRGALSHGSNRSSSLALWPRKKNTTGGDDAGSEPPSISHAKGRRERDLRKEARREVEPEARGGEDRAGGFKMEEDTIDRLKHGIRSNEWQEREGLEPAYRGTCGRHDHVLGG